MEKEKAQFLRQFAKDENGEIGADFFLLFQNADIEIETDTFDDMMTKISELRSKEIRDAFMIQDSETLGINGWSTLQAFINTLVLKSYKKLQKKFGEFILYGLESFQLFKGIHEIQVVVGSLSANLLAEGLDVCALLPSKESVVEYFESQADDDTTESANKEVSSVISDSSIGIISSSVDITDVLAVMDGSRDGPVTQYVIICIYNIRSTLGWSKLLRERDSRPSLLLLCLEVPLKDLLLKEITLIGLKILRSLFCC
jgi:hypothetical protein